LKKAILITVLALGSDISVAQNQDFRVLNDQLIVKQGQVLIVDVNKYILASDIGVYAFGSTYTPNKNGRTFIGVDSEKVKPGLYVVYLVNMKDGSWVGSQSSQVEVLSGSLPVVRINKKSASSQVDSKRRAKESQLISGAYARGSKSEDFTDGDFIYPLKDLFITGPFGFRAYSNATFLHRGVDLRATAGTSVLAVNSGKVVLAKTNFSLEGNMVILDHGSGVFSIYMHLSRILVKEGQTVNKGQIIALSGNTGSSTGPHLHLAFKVSGTIVDPFGSIEVINKY